MSTNFQHLVNDLSAEDLNETSDETAIILAKQLSQLFPIHWIVWNNSVKQLEQILNSSEKLNIEAKDPRGRTPLMLAVSLGHFDCARLLLKHNANVNIEDSLGFNVLHEAVSSCDPEFIREVLERRDWQRYTSRVDGIPVLLKKICDTPDFYVEMKWEFTSWVPLVTRMCPSDTYKIYKSRSSVRIDTTLVGFDQSSNWQRGSRSYIFTGTENGAVFLEVDHDKRQVIVETMKILSPDSEDTIEMLKPSDELVNARLTSPTSTTFIDTDKIHFERSKSGIIGFRTDRTETVNGYESKVFTAHNVEVLTKTRTEHLSDDDKERHKSAAANRLAPLQSLLGMIEIEENAPNPQSEFTDIVTEGNQRNPFNITAVQYFDADYDLKDKDIGRPKEMTTKTQRFKANLWLCENYPLSLPEQVLPIVDLMAISSSHFAKLRDFITLQLPSGFPVKIEIPLFHVLNARITFGNIFSLDEAVAGITPIKDDNACACVVDESCFEPPPNYKKIGTGQMRQMNMDDDDVVQYAIEQYLMEEGTETDQVTLWEALKAQQPDMDQDLQRAIQESLVEYQKGLNPSSVEQLLDQSSNNQNNSSVLTETGSDLQTVPNGRLLLSNSFVETQVPVEDNLELALRLSQQEREEEEKRLKEEEELLEQVLKLSITDK